MTASAASTIRISFCRQCTEVSTTVDELVGLYSVTSASVKRGNGYYMVAGRSGAVQSPQRFSCRVEVRGDGVHLIVSGGLDRHTGDDLDRAVRDVLTGRPGALVLDLSTVEPISAEGTAALVNAVHRAAMTCASVAILPSRAVRKRLVALGLDEALVLQEADSEAGHTPPAASA